MPKQIPEQELESIVAIVAAHSGGVQVNTLRRDLPFALPPRMLQRRLSLLIEQGRIEGEGHGRGRHYRMPVQYDAHGSLQASAVTVSAQGEVYIPVSPEGDQASHASASATAQSGRLFRSLSR